MVTLLQFREMLRKIKDLGFDVSKYYPENEKERLELIHECISLGIAYWSEIPNLKANPRIYGVEIAHAKDHGEFPFDLP